MKTPTYKLLPLTKTLTRKARLLALAGDPTRIRILCFMFRHKKACVSDVAQSLDMSIAAISHHLQIMRDNGFFSAERLGNNICYTLKNNEFIKGLKKIICDLNCQ
ncbi:helix-turn-helix transcriptional regulator [Candidatus Wolfebacteria bacterium]|nr:helix-turn-helix transcriptional regulator [Candidatus Wolfebacteria bacterium]